MSRARVNRPLVGVIAVGLLCTWAAMWFAGGAEPSTSAAREGESASTPHIWQAAFLRVGLLMAAIWLALPSKNRDAAWADVSLPMLGLFVAVVVAIAVKPRVAVPLLIVLGIAAYFIRPRGKQRPRSRTPT